jgi:valyl-tRNA synthetase
MIGLEKREFRARILWIEGADRAGIPVHIVFDRDLATQAQSMSVTEELRRVWLTTGNTGFSTVNEVEVEITGVYVG